MDEAKNQINDLEQKEAKNNHTEQEKRIQKNEDSIKSLWDNYKRMVYSAHTKGTPRVPSWGDREGCATGPCRIPTTLGHAIKTWSQSNST